MTGKPEVRVLPPLQGEASVVIAMRKMAAERGWSEQQLLERAEAARRKIQTIRNSGGEVRNPAGFGLTLVQTMHQEEVEQFLSRPVPGPKAAWWEGKLDRSRAEAEARQRAREEAEAEGDEPEDDELAQRRRRIKRGAFDAASVVAARRRVLGAQHASLPEGVRRRVSEGRQEEPTCE